MNIVDFLEELRETVNEFTFLISNIESETIENRRENILKFELALMYYKVIEFYFRDTNISGDDNIMSQSELQVVIDKLNNIMDSYLYTDFS